MGSFTSLQPPLGEGSNVFCMKEVFFVRKKHDQTKSEPVL